jgi:hypothetical protein
MCWINLEFLLTKAIYLYNNYNYSKIYNLFLNKNFKFFLKIYKLNKYEIGNH